MARKARKAINAEVVKAQMKALMAGRYGKMSPEVRAEVLRCMDAALSRSGKGKGDPAKVAGKTRTYAKNDFELAALLATSKRIRRCVQSGGSW